jgi:hypothetical protein
MELFHIIDFAMPKSMSEKQLAANRANAKKAGSPKGKLSKETLAARRVIKTDAARALPTKRVEIH